MKSKVFILVISVLAMWLVVGAGLVTAEVQNLYSLYVVDNGMDSVIKFDGATGALIGTFASGGDGGRPYGLTCGPNGNLLVSREETDQVVEFDGTTGAFVRIFADDGLNNPTGLAFGPNGNLFVSNRDSGTVVEFDGTTGAFVRTFASGSGLASGPFSLAFGPNGNLFVASGHFVTDPGTVIEFDGATGVFVRTFASVVQPRGLTFGPNGNLFVASPTPNSVTEFDGSTGALVRTFSDGLNHPHGVTFGPNGNLFVSNFYSGNVVEFDSGTSVLIGTFVSSGLFKPIELKFGPSSGPCHLIVDIDIKPGSDPNSINPKSKGVIPVAILTTEDFDATTVAPLSVEFGPDGAMETHGKGHIEDVDEDGDLDLVLHFKTQDTGIQCGDTEASLTGETYDGQAIEGFDSINTVGCK